MSSLDQIETIVVVMMENRSFDHMLGALSLQAHGGRDDLDGLSEPLDQDNYINPAEGEQYAPAPFEEDRTLPIDVPHDRAQIAEQMNENEISGEFEMDGFVRAHIDYQRGSEHRERDMQLDATPMKFFTREHVPVTHFFADEYLVCDRWFAPLPTSTQPNKLMSLKGDTPVADTTLRVLPTDLVFDWLDEHEVDWRVYHAALSFITMFRPERIFESEFRDFRDLANDVKNESPEDFPNVIFVEPSYQSSPHLWMDEPNDNHAPLPVANAERFLRNVYDALTANEDRWARTLMIVAYDEHGGFWDHVSPPRVGYAPPHSVDASDYPPFQSMGSRVPGLLVSPLVERRSVYSERLDHTSILQLLAEKFAPEEEYSQTVARRRDEGGVHSLSDALNRDEPRTDVPNVPDVPGDRICNVQDLADAGFTPGGEPPEQMFRHCAERLMEDFEQETREKHEWLFKWARNVRPYEAWNG